MYIVVFFCNFKYVILCHTYVLCSYEHSFTYYALYYVTVRKLTVLYNVIWSTDRKDANKLLLLIQHIRKPTTSQQLDEAHELIERQPGVLSYAMLM